MNRSVRLSDEQARYLAYLLFFFGSIAIAIPISSQSLWIDEGFTVFFASQPSFEKVINELVTTHRAESLMPGYVL
jgi:hypothetical protein